MILILEGFAVWVLQLGWVLTPGTFANREEVRPGTGREAGLGHVGGTSPGMDSVERSRKPEPRASTTAGMQEVEHQK